MEPLRGRRTNTGPARSRDDADAALRALIDEIET
jgi:hypothetical protein